MKSRAVLCRFVALTIGVVLTLAATASAATYRVRKVSTSFCSFAGAPQVNSSGQIVWACDSEIYLYDGATVRNISNTPAVHDEAPQISDGGQVVWMGRTGSGDDLDWEIYLYDGTSARNISNHPGGLGAIDIAPHINAAGQVVWMAHNGGWYYDIYLYTGGVVTNISNSPGVSDDWPQINESGQVVWTGWSGSDPLGQGWLTVMNYDIYFYDGATIANISNSPEVQKGPAQINDDGRVVWVGRNGTDLEIYLYDGTGVTNISNNPDIPDYGPQINASGQVVWWDYASGQGGREIYRYDGTGVTNISNSPGVRNSMVQINAGGQVVWRGMSSNTDFDIYVYDGSTVTNISNDTGVWEYNPAINSGGQVVWRGRASTEPWAVDIYSAVPDVSPTQQIADLLALFDTSVADGTLPGAGAGNSGQGRQGALRNMIAAAGDLIDQARYADAIAQLKNIYDRCDGAPLPPDFVSGSSRDELAAMVQTLMASLQNLLP